MKEIKYVQIGERLREERLRLGISQVDFAEKCDASRNALLQWERGETAPNAGVLAVMSAIGVDVLYVITGQRVSGSLDRNPEYYSADNLWHECNKTALEFRSRGLSTIEIASEITSLGSTFIRMAHEELEGLRKA